VAGANHRWHNRLFLGHYHAASGVQGQNGARLGQAVCLRADLLCCLRLPCGCLRCAGCLPLGASLYYNTALRVVRRSTHDCHICSCLSAWMCVGP
jgi:hypothetical protein